MRIKNYVTKILNIKIRNLLAHRGAEEECTARYPCTNESLHAVVAGKLELNHKKSKIAKSLQEQINSKTYKWMPTVYRKTR